MALLFILVERKDKITARLTKLESMSLALKNIAYDKGKCLSSKCWLVITLLADKESDTDQGKPKDDNSHEKASSENA